MATKITSTLSLPVADVGVGDKWGEVGRELGVGAKTPSAVRTSQEGGQNLEVLGVGGSLILEEWLGEGFERGHMRLEGSSSPAMSHHSDDGMLGNPGKHQWWSMQEKSNMVKVEDWGKWKGVLPIRGKPGKKKYSHSMAGCKGDWKLRMALVYAGSCLSGRLPFKRFKQIQSLDNPLSFDRTLLTFPSSPGYKAQDIIPQTYKRCLQTPGGVEVWLWMMSMQGIDQ